MQFDDGFALRDGIEDLGDTVRDIVFHDELNKQSRQGDTNHRSDEIPPVVLRNEMMLHQMLDAVDHHLEQLCGTGCQCAHKKTQDQDEVFL